MKRKVICSTLLILLCMSLSGLFIFNESDKSYDDDQIPVLIKNGAIHFLKSQSYYLLFLSEIENQNTDFTTLNNLSTKSIDYLNAAHSIYTQLVNVTKNKPVLPEIEGKLKAFDYDSFQNQNGLIPLIFSKVKSYLQKSDVSGTYQHFTSDIPIILELLSSIKDSIQNENLPSGSICWLVTQKYSQINLFGQYVTRVFNSL